MAERRARRAWPAVVLLATLLVPAVGSEAQPDPKGSRRARIEKKLEKLDRKIHNKETRAGALKERIDALNRAITETQIQINQLDARISEIEDSLSVELTAIRRTRREIDRIEARATSQAVELYKAGSVDILDALLTSESLAELNDRIELLGIAARETTDDLIRFHRLQLEVRHSEEEAFAARRQLKEEKATRSAALTRRNDLKRELGSQLEILEVRLDHDHEKEGNLLKAYARITGDIEALQARQSAAALGTSSYGFIWPLNGGVTSGYGYRWGRMHSGIDIDGYTGQPLVAVKDGVVILSSYYGGYGNTVVVDHGGGIASLYAHLSVFEAVKGQRVEQGQIVGRVGCTGSCTGDHLHFEVRVNGDPRNPMDYLP